MEGFETDIDDGLWTLFCRHRSASLLIHEKRRRRAARLEAYFARIAPRAFSMSMREGRRMPAHCARAHPTQRRARRETPADARNWQGIFRRASPRPPRRQVVLHLSGEEGMSPIRPLWLAHRPRSRAIESECTATVETRQAWASNRRGSQRTLRAGGNEVFLLSRARRAADNGKAAEPSRPRMLGRGSLNVNSTRRGVCPFGLRDPSHPRCQPAPCDG